MKSNAPSRVAATASSIVAWPEIMTTGISDVRLDMPSSPRDLSVRSRSRPLSSPSLTSSRMTSTCSRASTASASAIEPASWTTWPSPSSTMRSVRRMFFSSSTIRIGSPRPGVASSLIGFILVVEACASALVPPEHRGEHDEPGTDVHRPAVGGAASPAATLDRRQRRAASRRHRSRAARVAGRRAAPARATAAAGAASATATRSAGVDARVERGERRRAGGDASAGPGASCRALAGHATTMCSASATITMRAFVVRVRPRVAPLRAPSTSLRRRIDLASRQLSTTMPLPASAARVVASCSSSIATARRHRARPRRPSRRPRVTNSTTPGSARQ